MQDGLFCLLNGIVYKCKFDWQVENNDLSPQVESNDSSPPVKEVFQATLCSQGKHHLILDEEIGLICKFCPHVHLEIKYMVPEFVSTAIFLFTFLSIKIDHVSTRFFYRC